jgi:enamine deaminase RidA (YjgF/YER057c/UK114 family)
MARPWIREGSIRANLAAHFGLAADKMVALATTIHAKESIMTTETHPVSPALHEAATSRREFVTAAVTLAAGGGAATGAQAQTPSNLRFMNPPGMSNPPGYSHVVEVTGPHRVVYFAGQTGTDASGKVVGTDFRAQAVQVFENIKLALASVGAGFEHIVKMTAYHTNLDANAAIYRDVRASYFPNKAALPGHTLLQISRLANPAY